MLPFIAAAKEVLLKVLLEETSNPIIQFFRTATVGVISLVVDVGVLFVLTENGIHYLVSAAFSFFVSLVLNYFLTRKFIFIKCNIARSYELFGYLIIALTGLGLTELLMFCFTEKFSLHYLVSKFFAAAVVLIWTFTARKRILYR